MQNYQIKQLFYGHTQQENEIEALRQQIASANDTIEKLKKDVKSVKYNCLSDKTIDEFIMSGFHLQEYENITYIYQVDDSIIFQTTNGLYFYKSDFVNYAYRPFFTETIDEKQYKFDRIQMYKTNIYDKDTFIIFMAKDCPKALCYKYDGVTLLKQNDIAVDAGVEINYFYCNIISSHYVIYNKYYLDLNDNTIHHINLNGIESFWAIADFYEPTMIHVTINNKYRGVIDINTLESHNFTIDDNCPFIAKRIMENEYQLFIGETIYFTEFIKDENNKTFCRFYDKYYNHVNTVEITGYEKYQYKNNTNCFTNYFNTSLRNIEKCKIYCLFDATDKVTIFQPIVEDNKKYYLPHMCNNIPQEYSFIIETKEENKTYMDIYKHENVCFPTTAKNTHVYYS